MGRWYEPRDNDRGDYRREEKETANCTPRDVQLTDLAGVWLPDQPLLTIIAAGRSSAGAAVQLGVRKMVPFPGLRAHSSIDFSRDLY